MLLALSGAGAETAGRIDDALAARGIESYDILGHGAQAALALRLAHAVPPRVRALVLLGPTFLGIDGAARESAERDLAGMLGEIAVPTLCLFGTRDMTVPVAAARHYRERIRDCNLVFVYDAGQAMADERPEAVSSIVLDFLERHDQFLVRRQSDVMFP